MEKKLEYRVRGEDLPCCVRQVLQSVLGLSGREIRSAKFREDGIMVNGRRARVTQQMEAGDWVEVLLEQQKEGSLHLQAEEGDIQILYEDQDLVMVNKPPGIPVHPGHGHYRDTLANYLVYEYRKRGAELCIRAVGRLDKDTSGVVIFAKNRLAAARLMRGAALRSEEREAAHHAGELAVRMAERKRVRPEESAGKGGRRMVSKEYLALAEGCLPAKEGTVDAPIARKSGALNRMEVSAQGSRAVTHYRVLKEYPANGADTSGYSLLALKLETGRTHQIRVHMASIGHPLLGDPIYGKLPETKRIGRTALHCGCVELIQPFTGERIKVTAPLSEDMRALTGPEAGKE